MKVTYQDPSLPDGTEIGITGLSCLLVNNKEVDVPSSAVSAFENRTGKKFTSLSKSKKFKFGPTKAADSSKEEVDGEGDK